MDSNTFSYLFLAPAAIHSVMQDWDRNYLLDHPVHLEALQVSYKTITSSNLFLVYWSLPLSDFSHQDF